MSLPSVLSAVLLHLPAESSESSTSTSFSGHLPKVTSSSTGKTYYAKLGSPREAEQYAGEAASLNVFASISPGLAPNVLAHGIDPASGKPYMVSDYLDLRGRLDDSAAKELAKRLALEVHAHGSENGMYGFNVATFCGATRFENTWRERWDECFSGMIRSLLERINDTELSSMGEKVVTRVIPYLLGDRLQVQPSFLHGDLWSGNVGVLPNGSAVIYDPSSYFGHNEADLAIARIFGGFPSTFFSTYHSYRPKSEPVEEYDQRVELYELFHYLNHTLLFGSGYAGQSKAIMRRLIKFVDEAGV
ncbi:Ketosamine-3-kinase [Clavulina sp. PMI_390]|nr:Ketosamine-3-kinase [Clavulina sp. PMI_390]